MAESSPETTVGFVGVHPSEAERTPKLGWLPELAKDARGIGEIGMDPKFSSVEEGGAQRKLFVDQLGLAEKFRLPIQVHTRGAEKLCLELLSTRTLGRVLLHWFDGAEVAKVAADRGYFVSVGPAALYSRRIAAMAERYPTELLLTESDGPVAFGALGGVSGPALIPSVVFRLSEVKKCGFEEMALTVVRNSMDFLGPPSKG